MAADAPNRNLPDYQARRELPQVENSQSRGKKKGEDIWPYDTFGIPLERNALDWPPPRPQEFLSGIFLSTWELVKFVLLGVIVFLCLPVVAWASSRDHAVWKRILLVIWAFFCGIAALFWLPLWGIFIFLVVFFLGLVNTPAAILGWKSGSIWDRNFGKWVPVHPGIVSQTKDPSAESLVAGAGPAAGLGARASDEMPPHPDPAWAWPQPAAGTDEAWEKQMLRQLGMEEAEGVTEEELMHRMYRIGWRLRQDDAMAPVELDRVADAFLLLRHRSRLPPSLRALRLPPSAVLSEIFAASAVWPLLGELELITEARLGPDWLGTLCGRESRARARRRRGNKGGLQQEADEPVPRGNSEGRLGDASRRGQVPRERFVCAAGRLVEALMGVEMEDVAEVGMRLAEAMADGACKEDSPWGGKGAEVLLAVGHGFHEAAGLLEGRRSLGRWAAARISMVVGDVAWSMRRFFTERRLAEVQDAIDAVEREEDERRMEEDRRVHGMSKAAEGQAYAMTTDRWAHDGGVRNEAGNGAELGSEASTEQGYFVKGEWRQDGDVPAEIAELNLKRRAMEAEALPVMMEATWQQVEQDVRRACYQIAVLVGTGWMEMRKKDTQQQEGTAQKSVWDGADEAEAVAREAESWAAGVPPVVVDDVGEERHRRAVALAAVGRVAVQRATEAIHAAREGARGAERKEDIETVSDAHHVWRAITVAAHSAAEKMLGGATGGSG